MAIPDSSGMRFDQDCGDLQRRLARSAAFAAAAPARGRQGRPAGLRAADDARRRRGSTKSPCRHGVRTNSSSRDSSTGVVANVRASISRQRGRVHGGVRCRALPPERTVAHLGDLAIMLRRPAAVSFRRVAQLRAVKIRAPHPSTPAGAAACWRRWRRRARSGSPSERRSRKSDRSPAPRRRAGFALARHNRRRDRASRRWRAPARSARHHGNPPSGWNDRSAPESAPRSSGPARSGTRWDRQIPGYCRFRRAAARPNTSRPAPASIRGSDRQRAPRQ